MASVPLPTCHTSFAPALGAPPLQSAIANPRAVSSAMPGSSDDVIAPPHMSNTIGPSTSATASTFVGLSPDCVARVSGVVSDDLRQLSREHLDVPRWLNTTLSRVLESSKADVAARNPSTGGKPLQLEEQIVQLLLSRVQSHSQELSASIEDSISSTLVRLPRTTMELGRMSGEAAELAQQVHRINGIVRPSAEAGKATYVGRLQQLRASETKLLRCTRLLQKAAEVEEGLRNIQYLVEHRESGSTSENSEGSKKATTQQRDLDEVAEMIRKTREDLQEITLVDDTFGEAYITQLESFEQYVEHAIEEECVACLRTHNVERAGRLITTLRSIGRADVVLQRYGEQTATDLAAKQSAQLTSAAGDAARNTKSDDTNSASLRYPAAVVAALLQSSIIPEVSAFLSSETSFLAALLHVGKSSGEDDAATVASNTSITSAVSGGAVRQARASDIETHTNAVLDVITCILKTLYRPMEEVLLPLLTKHTETTNADCVACLAAIRQLKVTTTTTAATATSAAAAASPSTGSAVLDPLERLAREVTHRALALFSGGLQSEEVLQRYADRVCAPVRAFSARPLASILASPTTTTATQTATGDRESYGLSHVLTHAVQEVLVYMPEHISSRCIAAWHESLTAGITVPLRPGTDTSQHVLLQYLYVCRRRLKPLLAHAQQAVEDLLVNPSTQQRCPTGAGLVRASMQSQLWSPLQAEAEAVQAEVEQDILGGIIRPILEKVRDYASLPCWRDSAEPIPGGEVHANGGARRSVIASYAAGQAAPSAAVREMGEQLMELPLTLDTLVSSAVTAGNRSRASSTVLALNDADSEDGVRRLVEEEAEKWLEAVVHDVVASFLDVAVRSLHMGPFLAPSASVHAGEQGVSVESPYASALEQLWTDLDYVRSVLSAVNEEAQEAVEAVMADVRALPGSQGCAVDKPFVVGEAINEAKSVYKDADGHDKDGGDGESGVETTGAGVE